jgi:hypothetical protein
MAAAAEDQTRFCCVYPTLFEELVVIHEPKRGANGGDPDFRSGFHFRKLAELD